MAIHESMKIGLIGCGSIAQVHAQCISSLGEACQLTAVADCERERAERMGAGFGAVSYQDWRELLDREPLDVLHICTPHHLHTPMAEEALRRGISVFLEKPPAITWEQFDRLRAAADAARGKARLAVCFQNRLHPKVQYVRTLLQKGTLGKVMGLRGFVTWNRGGAYYSDSPWRGRLETEGGGALINQGIHTLDLMQYLVGGSAVSVDASCENFHLKDQIEVEDTLTAYIRYPEVRAILYVTTAYTADVPPLIEVQCERGCVRMEGDEVRIWREELREVQEAGKESEKEPGDAQGQGKDHERDQKKATEVESGKDREQEAGVDEVRFPERKGFGKSCWGSDHMEAIGGFYESIRNSTPYLLDFERVEETVKLMLRIYGSARGEEQVQEVR